MKKIEYEKKDGTKGVKYTLEPGDKIVSKFPSPKQTKLGKYDNYSIAVEGDEQYVQLTNGQYTRLMSQGDISGKTIEAFKYENDFGSQVGVRVL